MTAPVPSLALALATGFVLSMPVGPVSGIVIRRTLERGFIAGVAAGAGVALADALYGALGVIGATLPPSAAIASMPVRLLAGAVLVLLGIAALRAPVTLVAPPVRAGLRDPAAGFAATLLLGAANPGAILIVGVIFAAARLGPTGVAFAPFAGAALFAGAMIWWTLLAAVLVRVRSRLGPRWLRAINFSTGAIALGAGLAAIVGAFLWRAI